MAEEFRDFLTDSQLNINTTGRNDAHSDVFYYPYEPTSYSVLDRVIESGYISKNHVVLDYGCGYGRVLFYLNHKVGCKGIGIEAVEDFYNVACENLQKYKRADDIEFVHCTAEKYEVEPSVNCFFFFNPFSIEIFKSVIKRISNSYYDSPREITLFLYYPQNVYISHLMRSELFEFEDEIDCMDLFEKEDSRNTVVIFKINNR